VASNLYGWFYDRLNYSNEFPYGNLQNALKNNPIQVTGSSMASIERVKHEKVAMFAQEDTQTFFLYWTQCGISSMNARTLIRNVRFMFNKNSPLVKNVNRIIDEHQIEINLIKRKYLNVLRVCIKIETFK
jgi:hypothetical protein